MAVLNDVLISRNNEINSIENNDIQQFPTKNNFFDGLTEGKRILADLIGLILVAGFVYFIFAVLSLSQNKPSGIISVVIGPVIAAVGLFLIIHSIKVIWSATRFAINMILNKLERQPMTEREFSGNIMLLIWASLIVGAIYFFIK